MIKTLLSASLLALTMQGCFSSEPPKCSDEDVQETLKSVYGQLFTNSQNAYLTALMQNLPKRIDSLSSVRAVAYDEKVKMRSCKADVAFDNNQTVSVEYSVQMDEEDNENFYVELNTDFLQPLIQQNVMQKMLNETK